MTSATIDRKTVDSFRGNGCRRNISPTVSVSTVGYTGGVGELLKTDAFAAFYGLLQLEARVMDLVGREFERRTGMPVSWFEVLALLCAEEDGSQRMNELADGLLISRGGATKLIARIEEAGLVRRSTPPDDRRATVATITPAGMEAVERVAPVQAELVEQHFGRFLDRDDLQGMIGASIKVLDGLGAPCDFLRETQHGQAEAAPGAAKAG